MPTETVRIDWIRERLLLMRDRVGFPIVMTQPSGVYAADRLPLSVMGCSIWDTVANLQKQRQQIGDIQVTAQTIHEDEPPGRFQKINIRYTFTGRDLSEAHIKRAVQLTEDKYCSTYATLREVIELASDYMILKVDDAQPR